MWSVIIKPMKRSLIYFISVMVFAAGCQIDQRDILPEDVFTKIYNHPEETLAFFPESVMEMNGGGFLIISALKDEQSDIEYPSTYLVRTDASGEVTWAREYEWLAPCSDLVQQGNGIGFVAMNPQFDAYLVMVDPSNGEQTGQYDLQLTMPLSSFTDGDGNLLVLGYDFVTRASTISKFSSSITMERTIDLPINTDLQYNIQRHLNRSGQYYPFFLGATGQETGAAYFVNCFFNYTLRTVFLDRSSLAATGNIYSYQTEEGISSVMAKGAGQFGLTSYYEGNNYILPRVEINMDASQNIKDFAAEPLYELTYRARVEPIMLQTDVADYDLFVSQTNSNALVIYQYAAQTDSLAGTFYKAFDQKVEINQVIQSSDQGLVILASIHILGKYRRPLLVKIPVEIFLPEEE